MNKNAKRIALAGIGSAISLLFVVLSYYIDILTVSFSIFSTFGIMLPLSKKYYRESLISWLAVSLLGFFIVNIHILIFVLIGGGYTVFTCFWENKQFSYTKSIPIKFVYGGLIFFVFYKLVSFIAFSPTELIILKNFDQTLIFILFDFVFALLFIAYDWCLLFCYRYFKRKILPKIDK